MGGLSATQRRKRRDKWAAEDGYDSWKDYEAYAEELQGRQICGAPARKRDDHADDFPGPSPKKPCTASPMKEVERCRHHGGKSLVGTENPNYKTGKHSRFASLPSRLQERAEAGMKDPDLISVRGDITVNDAIQEDLWQKLDTGESTDAWSAVGGVLNNIRRAMDVGGEEGVDILQSSVQRLQQLVNKGMSELSLRREIREAQDHGRKLREAERKLLKEKQQFILASQAMAFFFRLHDIAVECIEMAADKGSSKAKSRYFRLAKAARDAPPDEDEIVQDDIPNAEVVE